MKYFKSSGGKISVGKLFGGMVIGAITGALRGIAGGPLAMFGSAVAGAGMGAFAVAMNDAAEIKSQNLRDYQA